MHKFDAMLWKEYWAATLRVTICVTAGRDRFHCWVLGADDWLTGSADISSPNQAEVDLLGQLGCM